MFMTDIFFQKLSIVYKSTYLTIKIIKNSVVPPKDGLTKNIEYVDLQYNVANTSYLQNFR